MIVPLWLLSIILGIVEGLTEFLPISSTGHLILTSHLFGFTGDRAEVFEIFIQLGAVIAVIVEYRRKLIDVVMTGSWMFFANLLIAFLPAAIAGLLLHDWISATLFGPRTVAAALIVGAVAIVVMEWAKRPGTIETVDEITPARAAMIGLAQCIALWPGFSRSAATILGGLGCGLQRKAATEFSFFLAIPTLGAATVYSLYKKHDLLVAGDMTWLLLATLVSFVVAWASIRWLIRFVATHDLTPFAWYRIALGIVVLLI